MVHAAYERGRVVTLEAPHARFRVVGWGDLAAGDAVYWVCPWMAGASGRTARGPFVVADPAGKTVRNSSGVVVPVPLPGIALVVPLGAGAADAPAADFRPADRPHPAAAVIDRLRGGGRVDAAEREALLDLADAALLLFAHRDGPAADPRGLDRGWRGIAVGLAHLAGRRHLAEA